MASPGLKQGQKEKVKNKIPISAFPMLIRICDMAIFSTIFPVLFSFNWVGPDTFFRLGVALN